MKIAICVPALLILMSACKPAENGPDSTVSVSGEPEKAQLTTIQEVAAPQQLATETPDEKVEFWIGSLREAARQENLAPDFVKQVEEILHECMDLFRSEMYLSSEHREALRVSLLNFMGTQLKMESPPRPLSSRKAYWLAYCMLAADRRYQKQDSSDDSSHKYEDLFESICDSVITPAFQRVLTPEDYAQWENEINDGMTGLRVQMLAYINRCRGDILCPFFRDAVDDSYIERPAEMEFLSAWFELDKHIPAYEEPTEMMVSKDIRYRAKLSSFFKSSAYDQTLFSVAVCGMKPELMKNSYWGHMKWGAENDFPSKSTEDLLVWPVKPGISPNERLNKIKNWTRASEKEISGK